MRSQQLVCILCWIVGGSLLLAALSPSLADAAEAIPEGLEVVSVDPFPKRVRLQRPFDYGQLVIVGQLATGETVDLTRSVELDGEPRLVSVSPAGLIRPKADGEEQLNFRYGRFSIAVTVSVSGSASQPDVSFVRDVQPALSRMGCNQGTCHGAREGKAGFKLSLRGYDPQFDHVALTDDIGARRMNRAAPDQSLMLLKATGSIPHVGGVRTNVGDPYYELVRAWIAAGARLDLQSPRVTALEVFPKNPILPRAGMTQQMVVVATYSDGAKRDVTHEAFVESGNIEVIEAGSGGRLTLLRRGEAPVLVRYEGAYTATTLTVMGDRTGFTWTNPPEYNYIDRLVYDKLRRVRIAPSDVCTDEEFVRRVFLDLTGLPPRSEQVRAFLDQPGDSRSKRDRLVDELVGSSDFIEHWTNKWADMLQVNRKFLGEEGAITLRNWIKQSLAANKPYDQMAYEILTASGSNLENPPAAYFKVLRDPAAVMENTTHLFLAVRFNCNKCHDHPFERWTQDQYYHLASYFAQVGRKEDATFAGQRIGGSAVEGAAPLVEVIYDTGSGDIKHDRTGQTATPAFPYLHDDLAPATSPRREQVARWITSAKNQYFATSYVNRLWGYLFGTGIIEPIDDIRAGNPPTNPELLRALTEDFIEHGFDMQHMMRVICKSRVYQHSVVANPWNEDDSINYSHAIPRRLPAEVLYDAIHLATGSRQRFSGLPEGLRAAELPDTGVADAFLDDFGRPVRESSCECERSTGMVLGPIMKLVNGPTVANALNDPQSELTALVAGEPDDGRLIEEIFLRFVARRPTARETQLALEAMQQVGDELNQQKKALADHAARLPELQAAWERSQVKAAEWTVLEATELRSAAGATLKKLDDRSIVVSGTNAKDTYAVVGATSLRGITGVKLEALPDESLPSGGPGRAANGNFVLSELRVRAAPSGRHDQAQTVVLQNAAADFHQDGWVAAGAIDGSEGTGWAIMPAVKTSHQIVFETASDIAGDEGGSVITVELDQKYPDGLHTLGRFRVSVTNSPRPIGIPRLPAEIAAILAVPADQRPAEQAARLAAYYQSLDAEYQERTAAVKQAEAQLKNRRLVGSQDLAWALINSPAFLFNR